MVKTITKPPKSARTSQKHRKSTSSTMQDPNQLLDEASAQLQMGQPGLALMPASSALIKLRASKPSTSSKKLLPAITLLGEIQLELGDTSSATKSFLEAVSIDPDGSVPEEKGGGAEKFFNMAQLSEEGGRASLGWWEKGITCLEREIKELEEKLSGPTGKMAQMRAELEGQVLWKKRKVAHALCGICELWMTDLSFEDEAEAQCEINITRAVMLAPEDSQTLQTLASIRLSQSRLEDAQSALEGSVSVWEDLPPEHPLVPDFPTRISLARCLMEAQMEDLALEVVERLVGEDDQSVEAWYLGGWCLWLLAQEAQANDEGEKTAANDADTEMREKGTEDRDEKDPQKEVKTLLMSSREWLRNCLKLYGMLDYEDDRLRDHTKELVEGLDKELGDEEIDDEDEWDGIDSTDEDEVDDEDHEMEGT